jgi:hypothetical protein
VAISNGRLISFSDTEVRFRWRDSADGNKQKSATIDSQEFIRRFLLHILPEGSSRFATLVHMETLVFRAVAEVSLRSAFMNAALLFPIFRLPASHKINQHSLLTGSFRRRLTSHSHHSIP